MPVVPNKNAPLTSVPTGGTAAGAARQYSTNLGAPMQPGTNAVGAFSRGSEFYKPITDGLQQVARVGSDIIQRSLQEQAETEALDAYTAWAEEMNEFVDNDIMSRKGLNAFHVVDEVAEFAAKGEERHAKNLTTDAARKMFSGRALDFRRGVQSKVSTYQGGERRQARFNAIESAAATEKDLALNNFGNDRLFAEGKARGLQLAAELAAMNGWDEKTTALYLQKAAGEYDAGRIERFAAAGDYNRAFDEWKGSNMSADAKFKTGQALGKARFDAMLEEAHRDPLYMQNELQKRGYGGAADFAAQRESNGNPGAIGYDQKGGTSYGAWQISSANMPAFIEDLAQTSPEWAERLRAAGPANTGSQSGALPTEWKKIAVEDPDGFKAAQQKYIQKTHIDPVLNGMAPDVRGTFEQNPTLMEVLYSTAVQHGPGGGKGSKGARELIASAWEKSGGDPRQLIESLYEDRKTCFSGSTASVRDAVIKRLDEEKATALASLSGDTSSPDRRLDPQTVDDLLGPAALYRVKKAADAELKQQAAVLLHGADDAFSFARQTGDFSHVQKLETRLLDLGQTDAALELKESRTLYQQAEPLLRSSPNEPLLARAQQAQSAIGALRTPQNSARVDKVMGAVIGDINREQTKFKHDPAGYVASNPLLQDEGLTPEAKIKTSLELQQRIGAGMGVTPQVLTAPEAAELQQKYEGTTDFGEKAKIGMALYQMYGRYAVTAATEAKMPAAMISIAQVAPNMTPGDVTKLVIAAEATEKDMPPLTLDEKKNRETAVANSRFLNTLATMSQAMYASEDQKRFYADMQHTLTNYSLMRGNLKDFESKFQIVNDSDMAIIAPRGTPLDENALRTKTDDLINSLESADFSAMFQGTPLENALGPLHQRFIKENYRSMYDNGVWMYDPQEEGYVLWDKATGRAAPDLDGFPVIMRAEHMTGPRHYSPQMVKLQRGLK